MVHMLKRFEVETMACGVCEKLEALKDGDTVRSKIGFNASSQLVVFEVDSNSLQYRRVVGHYKKGPTNRRVYEIIVYEQKNYFWQTGTEVESILLSCATKSLEFY